MKKNYKCKSCGGHLFFNPENQSLTCEYCNNEIALNNKAMQMTKKEYSSSLSYEVDKNIGQMFNCSSCNSNISSYSDKPINRCPSCGNVGLIQVQQSGIHPMEMIPFKISNDKAGEIFKKWLHSRKFAPNNLKKMAKLKKISGTYVPLYLFDFDSTTKYSATCRNYKKDNKGRVVSSSTYHVRETEKREFRNHIFSANKNFKSFTFKDMKGYIYEETYPYSSDYLLGFSAISTDFNVQESYNQIENDIKQTEYRRIKSNLNMRYDDVDFFVANTTISNIKNSYLYAPIWTNHYKYKNKDYHCYINGQTGKVTGKSPKSFWKILGLILGIAGLIAILIFLLNK